MFMTTRLGQEIRILHTFHAIMVNALSENKANQCYDCRII